MKRFTAAALSIVLSVGVSAGVAQAQDFSDPATTPGKITAHPKKQSLLQPPVEATIYAEPYGIVPDHHAAANFSPLGTRKSAKIRGSLHQPLRYSLFFNSFEECQADFDPYAHDFSVMNAIIPPHWIWMAKMTGHSRSVLSAIKFITANGYTNTTISLKCQSSPTPRNYQAATRKTFPQNNKNTSENN